MRLLLLRLPLFVLLLFALPWTAEAVLIDHYPFEGNANDRVGAYDGVVVGPLLTVDRFGMADSAYAFDGIDDRINIGNPNLVNFTEDFSFTMWVNSSNAGNPNNSFPTFISKYSGVGSRETFFFGFNGLKTGLTAEITDETNEFTTVVVSVPDGEWHHVAIRLERATPR